MPHACTVCCPSLWHSSTGWYLQAYASSGAGTSVASASASASVVQATNNTIAALTQVAAAAGGPTNLCCLGAAYADILVALLEANSPQVRMSVDVPPFAHRPELLLTGKCSGGLIAFTVLPRPCDMRCSVERGCPVVAIWTAVQRGFTGHDQLTV